MSGLNRAGLVPLLRGLVRVMDKEEKRILLVEDEKGDALLVRNILGKKNRDWMVYVTKDAREAGEWLSKNKPPDVIITDYMFPIGSGFDVVKIASQIGEYGVPVIMLTGTGDETLAVQALKSGASDYLSKNFDEMKSLPKIIERALRDWDNIVERKKTETRIRYMSVHDSLTDLYSRVYFVERMNVFDALKSYPVSIVVADIDNFKAINDNFGHPVGDIILKNFADILKKNAQSGEVVARIGGDEFAVIMPEASEMVVREFCNAISRNCEKFEHFGESPKLRRAVGTQDTALSVSLGYATQRGQFASIEDAQREADRRMYEDKIRKKRFGRMEEVVQVLQIVMRERIPHVLEHSKRLQELIITIGVKLKLSESAMADLSISALFHDIGKLGIPDALLSKEEVLTEQEMKRMKQHTVFGYELLRNISVLSHIAEYVLYHHERWDGNGYPEGLKGDGIPYFSRIISLVDAYEAMICNRPYRRAMSEDEANEKIKMGANTQFDPELVDLFFKIKTDAMCI
ncbi:hypothetical protein C4E24_07300 [ANME-1 cluster archaeon AG-394-G21]|nr:hypothetical protein [ANME-1 cluster archaeon AG-394-G21]